MTILEIEETVIVLLIIFVLVISGQHTWQGGANAKNYDQELTKIHHYFNLGECEFCESNDALKRFNDVWSLIDQFVLDYEMYSIVGQH